MEGVVIGVVVALAVICGLIWSNKGGNFLVGFVLGLLLGLIGLILVLVLKPSAARQQAGGAALTRQCPHCSRAMPRDAAICPNCQQQSAPWLYHEGRWWSKNDAGADYWLDERSGQWIQYGSETRPAEGSSNQPGFSS